MNTIRFVFLPRVCTVLNRGTQKRNRTQNDKNTQKEKAEKEKIVSKIEIKLQFPYVVPAKYEHHTAADTHLQHHCV